MNPTSSTRQFEPGRRVSYIERNRTAELPRPRRQGTVTGGPVYDPYTDVTWVPVHIDGVADDVEPNWVSAQQIVEVELP